jgi:hypothetical protein
VAPLARPSGDSPPSSGWRREFLLSQTTRIVVHAAIGDGFSALLDEAVWRRLRYHSIVRPSSGRYARY